MGAKDSSFRFGPMRLERALLELTDQDELTDQNELTYPNDEMASAA